jgi:8-oxo-dGTP pyrophosphatase MutT (NUDIX family)
MRRVETTQHRPAARVICLDAGNRILLQHWRDPSDGHWIWEPPGGGIEAGESPLQAARRELAEETGLDPAAVGTRCVPVPRDLRWDGTRTVATEQFFLARYDADRPAVSRAGLLAYELEHLRESVWLDWTVLDTLPDPVEPPELTAVLCRLAPDGPWTDGARRDTSAR